MRFSYSIVHHEVSRQYAIIKLYQATDQQNDRACTEGSMCVFNDQIEASGFASIDDQVVAFHLANTKDPIHNAAGFFGRLVFSNNIDV